MTSVCALIPVCKCVCAEWIEEHSSAAAPLANYAPNHLETYRDPQVPPTLPPIPTGAKRKHLSFIIFVRFVEFVADCTNKLRKLLELDSHLKK